MKLKKLLSIFMSLVMLTGITAGLDLTAYAAKSDGFEYEILNDGTVEITDYTGSQSDLVIPSTINGKTVSAISHCGEALTSVTIPAGIKEIYYGAFFDCSKLVSINVDENNSEYSSQDGVLFDKEKAALIEYPIGNTRKSYTIPETVVFITDSAFYNCNYLTEIYYSGTISQWVKNMSSDSSATGIKNAVLHCSNGNIIISEYFEYRQNKNKEYVCNYAMGASFSETKESKKQFKVTWKKVSGVSGYQVQYATDKKFKKNKKNVTVKGAKNTSKTVKNLKSKKTYYVRVRTYKTVKVNGKATKVYSGWSKAKTVKTK